MKILLSLAVITFCVITHPSVAASEKEDIIQMEKAVWQCVKDKKMDEFRKHLADDLRAVYDDGIRTADQEVASVRDSDLKSFSLSDIDVVFIDKNAAMVTYKATTQGTSAGKDFSGTYNAATVWKKKNGGWVVIFHTDIKAAEKSSGN